MATLVLFAILAAALWLLAAPLFESVLTVMLLGPLLSLVVSRGLLLVGVDLAAVGAQQALFGAALFLLVSTAYLLFGRRSGSRTIRELYPFGVVALVFSATFYMSSVWWPDFIALGERLRDYSLIASAAHNPVVAMEPWMAGTPLNYYVYWYRFGAMLKALLGLELWDVYHALVALSMALYSAVCFQIVRVVLQGNTLAAALSAVLIPFGSNVMGMLLLTRTEDGGWQSDLGWWGASRVVRGAITEFPAWSFLLGDAHPHYLNLVTVPFLFLLLYRTLLTKAELSQRVLHSTAVVIAGVLFLAGSNAWEVPMWLGLALLVVALAALRGLRQAKQPKVVSKISVKAVAMQVAAWVVVMVALRLNSSHITADAGSVGYVADPIAVTSTAEMLAHWGVHILCLTIGLLFFLPFSVTTVLLLLVLIAAFAFSKAAAVLFLLLAGYLYLASTTIGAGERQEQSAGADCKDGALRFVDSFAYALIISGLGLLIAPEIVFLNDPYGGENERMNTIFKIYSSAWGMLGLGATAILVGLVQSFTARRPLVVLIRRALVVLVVVMCAVGSIRFNLDVIAKRQMPPSEQYGREGLARVDAERPGAGGIIRTLRALPFGAVLEGQGNAYSYATFVSTLAGQPAYLGWENHLNLLSQVKGEVSRRLGIVEKIYGDTPCRERLILARSEGIRYVVWGANERATYPAASEASFTCFSKIADEQEFALFEVSQ
jgi:uncharacterized membrane protein